MRIHRPFRSVVGNRSWATVHLATRTPVEQPSVTQPTNFDGVATTRAALAVAPVHGETGPIAIDRAGRRVQVHLQDLAGRGDDPFHVGAAEHGYRRKRMLLTGPEDFAAEHVADAPGDLLIQQCVGDGRIEVGIPAESIDGGAQVRVADAEVGAGGPEPGMSVGVELSVRLDGASAETDCRKAVDR